MKRKWKKVCIRKNDKVISLLRAFVRINTFEALMKGRDYYPGCGLFYSRMLRILQLKVDSSQLTVKRSRAKRAQQTVNRQPETFNHERSEVYYDVGYWKRG